MKLKVQLAGLAMVATMLLAFAIVPVASAAPAPAANSHSHRPPVTMTANYVNSPLMDAVGNQVGTFTGVAKVTHVDVVGGHLVGSGTLIGIATQTATGATENINQSFSNVPIDPPATCTILDLTLGPINLNLLGLVVQTNTIHLTITAVPGPGNLLGNLLCAVANLLNGTGTGGLSTAIQNLLNQINALLAGL